MGAIAAVVGFRRGVDSEHVVGQTDDYLVARVRAGDELAFEAIYDRYAGGVLAFCVHLLGSRDAAEDALQLTFVAAYRALRRAGEREIALRPWLYTIARNRCVSELRARREAALGDSMLDEHAGPDSPVVHVQRREELRELLADMQRLPADQRAALVLFELGDQSHAEIAIVLGVRREKVKALIFQAREALVRGRKARERPCAEVREHLATVRERILPRSTTRAHIDRCPSCAAYEAEVRRQRAAFALLVPVAAAGQLKASVLASALGGGGRVAAAALGASGGGAAAVTSGGAVAGGGSSAVAGAATVAASGATISGGGAAAAAAAGGAASAGAVAAGAGAAASGAGALGIAATPVAAVATGLTAAGAEYVVVRGFAGSGPAGLAAKLMSAVAIATGVVGGSHAAQPVRSVSPVAIYRQATPAIPAVPIAASISSVSPPGAPGGAKLGADTGRERQHYIGSGADHRVNRGLLRHARRLRLEPGIVDQCNESVELRRLERRQLNRPERLHFCERHVDLDAPADQHRFDERVGEH
jgi:RNA polymerase sigma factor (sigma-70 family)